MRHATSIALLFGIILSAHTSHANGDPLAVKSINIDNELIESKLATLDLLEALSAHHRIQQALGIKAACLTVDLGEIHAANPNQIDLFRQAVTTQFANFVAGDWDFSQDKKNPDLKLDFTLLETKSGQLVIHLDARTHSTGSAPRRVVMATRALSGNASVVFPKKANASAVALAPTPNVKVQ